MKNNFRAMAGVLVLSMTLMACDKNNNTVLLSVQQDKDLGLEVSREIENDPQYRILAEEGNEFVYNYLYNMRDEILNSGEVAYKDEFAWQLKIVQDDDVLNAFAAPGGYIYVYTGLIKFLDRADDLAGVLGHEIAHADLRHTSRNLTRQYGLQVLVGILLGDNASSLAEIAASIAGSAAVLKFSREFETEADAKSVEYLANTRYACNGAAFFFEKLDSRGQGASVPEFLSTHPNPDNRIEAINNKAEEANCSTIPARDTQYEAFKGALP